MKRTLYVYAIVPGNVRVPRIAGHAIERVELGAVAAVAERRTRPRPVSEKALRDQYRVVASLHAAIDAILPARFGALVEEDELARIVGLRRRLLVSALRKVRARSQMTVRVMGPPAERTPASTPGTGTEYLLSRVESSRPAITPVAEMIRRSVEPLVSAESIDRGRGSIQLTINHLVPNARLERYRSCVANAAAASPEAVVVTGPMAPFAFAPDIWHEA